MLDQRFPVEQLIKPVDRSGAILTAVLRDCSSCPAQDCGRGARHQRLDASSVPRELVDNQTRNEQLQLALVGEHTNRDDQWLTVSPLGQV